jgi:Cu-processing system permease protein
LGSGLPFLYFSSGTAGNYSALLMILGTGTALTFIFIALSFFISVYTEDRVKGLGILILIWLFFTIIYDGLVLFFIYAFADYPLEKVVILLSCLNPVDLGRIILLIEFDVSAMMGYTGAVFQNFFGSSRGILAAGSSLIFWLMIPLYLGMKKFVKKDF